MNTPTPQPLQVMIVDDSAVVRGMVTRALEADPEIVVAGSAPNGQAAIGVAERLQPDVIILDLEMPEMDGMTALPHLLKAAPHTKIVIASTLSLRNAEISLRALELGASDYLPKPSSRGTSSEASKDFHRDLLAKVKALGHAARKQRGIPVTQKTGVLSALAVRYVAPLSPLAKQAAEFVAPMVKYPAAPSKALAIGSSTGGPQALLVVVAALKGKLQNIPIFLTQHMPPTFTAILAEHLSKAGDRPCSEAKHGEEVQPGHLYVAPGDYHMVVARAPNQKLILQLEQTPPENYCRPAVDPMLRSLIPFFGKDLLTVILTGMGQDGMLGAQDAVKSGGSVIAQDEATSIVWGMPRAIAVNNLASAVLPIQSIGSYILKACGES